MGVLQPMNPRRIKILIGFYSLWIDTVMFSVRPRCPLLPPRVFLRTRPGEARAEAKIDSHFHFRRQSLIISGCVYSMCSFSIFRPTELDVDG